MKINSVQNNNTTAFGAEIVKTYSMERFYNSLYKESGSPTHKTLWQFVKKAVAEHPSDAKIYARINYVSETGKSKGVLSNLSDVYINENMKSTGYYAMWSTWKNILDPKNKKAFHNLFGKKYEPIYDSWWKENVQPIWKILSSIY